MDKETPQWLQEYQQPYRKRKAVDCHSNHRHKNNTPGAGFVLVRLNAASQLELLLDLRGPAVPEGNTYGFIGGNASTFGEAPLDTALREAKEEYNIDPKDLNILDIQYKSDHGGYRYLHYTYVFAEYNPQGRRAPAPKTFESTKSEWFRVDALPSNLIRYVKQDRQMLEQILYNQIRPMLLNRSPQAPPTQMTSAADDTASLFSSIDEDGDSVMTDVPATQFNVVPQFPSPDFKKCTSLNRASTLVNGEVKYPELPTINKTATGNKPGEPAPKGSFSSFMSKFWGPAELTSASDKPKGTKDDKSKKAESKIAPMPIPTPKATPEPMSKPATTEKKDEGEKKHEASGKPSLFARLFSSATRPAAEPLTPPKDKSLPVAGATEQVEPNKMLEMEQLKTLNSDYFMPLLTSDMDNFVPGHAYRPS